MTIRTILAALALCSVTSVAFAQASSPSRAEVKEETKEAAKNRELTPAGPNQKADDAVRAQSAKKQSTTTRSQRKAETTAAAKNRQLTPAGSNQRADDAVRAQSAKKESTTTRSQRKAEIGRAHV